MAKVNAMCQRPTDNCNSATGDVGRCVAGARSI